MSYSPPVLFAHPEMIAYFESIGEDMSAFTPMSKLPDFGKPSSPTATTEGVRKVLERLRASGGVLQ